MDLGLSDTQEMLKTSAREFLERECPHTLIREVEDDQKGYSQKLWQQIVELGWTGVAFPEQYGGTGGDFLDLMVLVEEAGRSLAPAPFFSTVVLGGLTVLDAGTQPQKEDILPKICNGQTIMTLALTEPTGTFEPSGVQLEAKRDGDDFILNGTKLFVYDAQIADLLIVAARTSKSDDGITLFLVSTDSPGVSASVLNTISGDNQCEVAFKDVRVPPIAVLGEIDKGWPIVERSLSRAAAAKCVETLGSADAVLDMTLDYAKQRVQFGRPIGTFQAVQHHLANMAVDVESCRQTTYRAAWKVSEGLPASEEISVAKAIMSEAYRRVCTLAHQCHGAIGFTQEHDLQLYTRRSRSQVVAFGDVNYYKEVVAQSLGL